MELTVLIENLVYNEGLTSEHGLSFYIEADNKKILFDTGQTDKFYDNALNLGIDLTEVDYLVISHGHYDHTGGIEIFLRRNHKAKIIIKKDALNDKYSNSTGKIRYIGIKNKNILLENSHRVTYVNDIFKIDNISFIGKIRRINEFEQSEKKLFILNEDNSYTEDMFTDEQVMIIENNDKIAIITGCAHSGIINIIDEVKSYFPNKKINSIVGGFHLKGVNKDRVLKTIGRIVEENINQIGINHCSGIEFYCELNNKCSGVEYLYTGKKIIF
ncbi:MAG: MBL fold metallo-hydrolase [Fusobacteria bacterium]|nr:MBL fold metallo-hydrolase [Fusobacteriota bacterium]